MAAIYQLPLNVRDTLRSALHLLLLILISVHNKDIFLNYGWIH